MTATGMRETLRVSEPLAGLQAELEKTEKDLAAATLEFTNLLRTVEAMARCEEVQAEATRPSPVFGTPLKTLAVKLYFVRAIEHPDDFAPEVQRLALNFRRIHLLNRFGAARFTGTADEYAQLVFELECRAAREDSLARMRASERRAALLEPRDEKSRHETPPVPSRDAAVTPKSSLDTVTLEHAAHAPPPHRLIAPALFNGRGEALAA